MSASYYDASRITAEKKARAMRATQAMSSTTVVAPAPLEPIRNLIWYVAPFTLEWKPPIRRVISYTIRIQHASQTIQQITTYRPIFTLSNLMENNAYSFHVSAVYDNGESMGLSTPIIWIPPTSISTILTRLQIPANLSAEVAFQSIFNTALFRNIDEPKLCQWMTAVAGAWQWICPMPHRMSGRWNDWDWNPFLSVPELKMGEKLGWLCAIINDIDQILFGKLPLFYMSSSTVRSIKSKAQCTAWWANCLAYLTSSTKTCIIDGSWNEPDDTEYGNAVQRMVTIRGQMSSMDEKNAWLWSCPTWKPWIWLTTEWCRCSGVSITDEIFLFTDLIYGMDQARQLIQTWPLQDSPMSWIRQHLANDMIPSVKNNAIYGYSWSSDSSQLRNTYLSPFALYGSVFGSVMKKWFNDAIPSYTTQYHYTDAMPFMPGTTSERTNYGTFNVSLNEPLVFSSWSDFVTGASMSAIRHGEGIDCAIESAQTIADRIVSSYLSVIPIHDPIIPITPVVPSVQPVTQPVTQPVIKPVTQPVIKPVIKPVPIEPYRISVHYMSITPPISVQTLINQAVAFIQSVVVQTHGKRMSSVSSDYDMIVDVDVQSLDPSILASSRPTIVNDSVIPAIPVRQQVTINSASFSSISSQQSMLNGTFVSSLVPILIHEMLHGMGIASYVVNSEIIGWDQMLDSTKTWYIGGNNGSEAIQAYQRAVGTPVKRIPIENSFGSGTAYSHWEEGLKDGFISEKRYYDYGSGPVYHPALPYEIMSGVAGNTYYFTDITAGALKDHGYAVNMMSPSIVPYPKNFLK